MSAVREGYGNRPYGAIELKMSYQRNMVIANMLVLTFIAALLITAWGLNLHSGPGTGAIVPKPTCDPPPLVIAQLPLGQEITIDLDVSRPRAVVSESHGWNLVPVDDDLIIEDRGLPDVTGVGTVGDPSDPGAPGLGENPGFTTEPTEDFPEYGIFVKVEREPVMITESRPEYPAVARRLGLEGKVGVAALVGSYGQVLEARIVKSSGSDALDAAALDAAYRNIYSPGIQNGRAIPVWVTYAVKFKLNE